MRLLVLAVLAALLFAAPADARRSDRWTTRLPAEDTRRWQSRVTPSHGTLLYDVYVNRRRLRMCEERRHVATCAGRGVMVEIHARSHSRPVRVVAIARRSVRLTVTLRTR